MQVLVTIWTIRIGADTGKDNLYTSGDRKDFTGEFLHSKGLR